MNEEPISVAPMTIRDEHQMSETRYHFLRFMHALFYRTLCPRPDGRLNMLLRGWPYNSTGRVAAYFHKKVCTRCVK